MSAASVRAEAKRLLALSLEGGVVSSELVGAVLAALTKSRSAHQLRPLLRAYLTYVRRELARGEARIEHAGPLSPADADAIAAHFAKAKAAIEADRVKMMNEVRGEVSRLVVETAAKVLEQNLDDATRGRLNEAAVKQLAR